MDRGNLRLVTCTPPRCSRCAPPLQPACSQPVSLGGVCSLPTRRSRPAIDIQVTSNRLLTLVSSSEARRYQKPLERVTGGMGHNLVLLSCRRYVWSNGACCPAPPPKKGVNLPTCMRTHNAENGFAFGSCCTQNSIPSFTLNALCAHLSIATNLKQNRTSSTPLLHWRRKHEAGEYQGNGGSLAKEAGGGRVSGEGGGGSHLATRSRARNPAEAIQERCNAVAAS